MTASVTNHHVTAPTLGHVLIFGRKKSSSSKGENVVQIFGCMQLHQISRLHQSLATANKASGIPAYVFT